MASSLSTGLVSAKEEGDLFENEDLAVLCVAIYQYQQGREGFDQDILPLKIGLSRQHMLELDGSGHRGDKAYFDGKVASVKQSLFELPAEGQKELAAEKWLKAGNPCDQIVAVTFILDAAEDVKAGKGMPIDDAREVLHSIYPWKDRYTRIFERGLTVQFNKANGGGNEQEPAPSSD